MIDPLILRANAEGASRCSQVFLSEKQFSRALVFVPIPDDGFEVSEIRDMVLAGGPINLPGDAVVRKWTDYYALAQEISFEYTSYRIVEVIEQDVEPYFSARVKLKLRAERRDAQENETQQIPVAPEGMTAWREPRVLEGRGWRANNKKWAVRLPTPTSLPGTLVKNLETHTSLGKSAVESLLQGKPKTELYQVEVRFEYVNEGQGWQLMQGLVAGSLPLPKHLRWEQGLPKDLPIMQAGRLRLEEAIEERTSR